VESHFLAGPSDWIKRWSHLVDADARVLDAACGFGRHMAWFAAHGCHVTGIDRSEQALDTARAYGRVLQADMEAGAWPLMDANQRLETFDVVVVTHYLWRPLFANLLDSLAPGGLLLYETFSQGNETVGKPSRADFLLQPGELLQRCQALRIVAFEDGFLDHPARFVQRIAAIKPGDCLNDTPTPPRYPLSLE